MVLTALFKHKVLFVSDDGAERYIGDVRTFNDCKEYAILGDFAVKIAERDLYQSVEKVQKTFVLGAKKAEEHSRKLIELIDHIDQRPHKILLVTVKRDGRKAIASACIAADLEGTGCSHGLRVTILLGEPPASNAAPAAAANAAKQLPAGAGAAPVSVAARQSSAGLTYNPNALYVAPSSKCVAPASAVAAAVLPANYCQLSQLLHASQAAAPPTNAADQPKRREKSVNFDVDQVKSFARQDPPAQLSAQEQAAAQYNKLDRRTATRHLSYIYHLRELNNCLKAAVVYLACEHVYEQPSAQRLAGLAVLELAMGKGGDFSKWLEAGLTRYVGADIAENSLRDFVDNRLLDLVTPEAERRAFKEEDRAKVQLLVVADLAAHSLALPDDADAAPLLCFDWTNKWHSRPSGRVLLPPAAPQEEDARVFDVVSCQFAMHYMCRSQRSFAFFLRQLSHHLHPSRGVYVATTVDCRVLAQYLRLALFGSADELRRFSLRVDRLPMSAADGAEKVVFSIVHGDLAAETVLLTVSFTMHNALRLLRLADGATPDAQDDGFGLEYSFTLFDQATGGEDSEGQVAVDAPEWIVPLRPSLLRMMSAASLEVQRAENFQRFFCDHCVSATAPPSVRSRLKKVRNAFQGMSPAEWALARLYLVLTVAPRCSQPPTADSDPDHWQREARRLFHGDSSPVSVEAVGADDARARDPPHGRDRPTPSTAPPALPLADLSWLSARLQQLQLTPESSPPASPRTVRRSPPPPPPSDAVPVSAAGGGRWLAVAPVARGQLPAVDAAPSGGAMDVADDALVVDEDEIAMAVYERTLELAGGDDAFSALGDAEQEALQQRADAMVRDELRRRR